MSDTMLALLVTLAIIVLLFAWVPLLHVVESMTRRKVDLVSRDTSRKTPKSEPAEESYSHHYDREIA